MFWLSMELHLHVDLCEVLLEELIQQLQRQFPQEQAGFEGLLLVAESLLSYVVQLIPTMYTSGALQLVSLHAIIVGTREVAQFLEHLVDCHQRQQNAPTRGRPKLRITEGQLVELLRSHFFIVDIATLFGCSSKTIYRRIHEFGLTRALQSKTGIL